MIRHVRFQLGSPILLPNQGPATPDSWLAWAHMTTVRPAFRTIRPHAADWHPTIDLPLARDARADVWAVSSIQFPEPGVWVPNTGYRSEPNRGDLSHRAEAFSPPVMKGQHSVESLFHSKEQSSGIYRAMLFNLSGWYTPQITFDLEFPSIHASAVQRLLDILASVGVGRKTADGYGTVRDWDWEDTDAHPVWDTQGYPRRPVPNSCVPETLEVSRYVYQLHEARWSGVPTLCAGPDADAWHPVPWSPPSPSDAMSDPSPKSAPAPKGS